MNQLKLLDHLARGLILLQDRFSAVGPDDAEWIIDRIRYHKLLPLAAGLNLPANEKCSAIQKTFEKASMEAFVRIAHYERQVRELFQVFADAAIIFVPYKGPFWGQFIYPDVTWRHMSDIDIFMSKEDARKASKILQKKGFRPDIVKGSEAKDFAHRGELTLFPKPGSKYRFPVQLHWALLPSHRFVNIGFLESGDFMSRSTKAEWKGNVYPLPPLEVQFLYYILHATCQHQFNRFVNVTTPAHFITQTPLDWDSVFALARKRRCLVPLYYGLKFIQPFFPLPMDVREQMRSIRPGVSIRMSTSLLTPKLALLSSKTKGKMRRKLYRVAMTW